MRVYIIARRAVKTLPNAIVDFSSNKNITVILNNLLINKIFNNILFIINVNTAVLSIIEINIDSNQANDLFKEDNLHPEKLIDFCVL